MVKRRILEAAQGEEDWIQARDVLVKSFHNYPLYVYMEPDELKRPEFLRRYLEANYEVTVRQGKGYLIIMRLTDDEKFPTADPKNSRIIGALLFVPVAEDGIGWAIQDDQIYFDAYERHKLGEVSRTCMDRVKEYESWEQVNITKKITEAKIPLWNGLFCALDSEYCHSGDGTICYEKTLLMMLAHTRRAALKRKIRQQNHDKSWDRNGNGTENAYGKNEMEKQNLKMEFKTENESNGRPPSVSFEGGGGHHYSNNDQQHPVIGRALSYIAGCSMLHHHPLPLPIIGQNSKKVSSEEISRGNWSNKEDQILMSVLPTKPEKGNNPEIQLSCSEEEIMKISKSSQAPALVAICHSSSSTHFHEKNGFRKVVELPYQVEGEREDVPFIVHVLSRDLFGTGTTDKLINVFQ